MCPTWWVATTLYREKLSCFVSYLSTDAGRYTVVPSVAAWPSETQPMFLASRSSVTAISISEPARPRQYIRNTSLNRSNSTDDDRLSSIASEVVDSTLK